MSKFLDGPAKGVRLQLGRAPMLLRVVQSSKGFDALDQLEDVPEPGEKVIAYYRVSGVSSYHISCRPRSNSGWYSWADYRVMPEQPYDAQLRDRSAWQQWCSDNKERLMRELPGLNMEARA